MEYNLYTSYKGRSLDNTKPVDVYRCLNRGGHTYSLKQGSHVIGHTSSILMVDCEFIVNKSGQNRARAQQVRNVHAFIRGFIPQKKLNFDSSDLKIFYYNPYKTNQFQTLTGAPLVKSDLVIIDGPKLLTKV